MWRHIQGVRKPREQTKRKPDDETKEGETKKKKRQFNEKWKTAGRECLVYDPAENVMYYTNCRTYGGEKMKGVSFVVGTNNFKVETIKDHEMSIGHKGCMATKQA